MSGLHFLWGYDNKLAAWNDRKWNYRPPAGFQQFGAPPRKTKQGG
jgi:hypothetical protein